MNQQIKIQAVFQKETYYFDKKDSELLKPNAANLITRDLSQKFKVWNAVFYAVFQKTKHEFTDESLRKFLKLGQRDLSIHIELKIETSTPFHEGQSMISPDESAFMSEVDESRTEIPAPLKNSSDLVNEVLMAARTSQSS